MSDQGGDASGGVPTGGGASVPIDPTLTPGGSPGIDPGLTANSPGAAPINFGAPPSQIAASAPMPAAGGGAVGAPGVGAPSSVPAGFDPSAMSPQSMAELQSPNPAQTASTQIALSGPDPNAPPGAAGGAPGGNSVMNAIRNPGFDTIMTAAGNNLGPLASLGVLGFEAANKPGGIGGSQLPAGAQPGPTAGALVSNAQQLQQQGQTLGQPLATGVLPPGAQAAVDQVTQQQEAQIRAQFAQMGLSGSSMEASAIANAKEAAQARGFQIAQQMAQQGLSDLNTSSQIFEQLLSEGLQSDAQFRQALTQFANSMAGGGGTTIKVGA